MIVVKEIPKTLFPTGANGHLSIAIDWYVD